MIARMKIRARVENAPGEHRVTLVTNDAARELAVAPKAEGRGSSANGGELLCLALATCFCNDAFREAARLGVEVDRVEVEVEADFGGRGEPASAIRYRVAVAARGDEAEIRALVAETDRVAEIHNTLRIGLPVTLEGVDVTALAPGD